MPHLPLVEESAASEEVKKVFNEIKAVFRAEAVPEPFRAMANSPAYLASTWERFKMLMGPGGKVDQKTKLVAALAASATNNSQYSLQYQTALARALGLTDGQITEILGVVAFWCDIDRFIAGSGIG